MSWFVEEIRRLGLPLPQVWVESGTFRGDTTAQQIGHFRKIITIELDRALAVAATERFCNERSVTVFQGDFAKSLAEEGFVQAYVQEPAVFYLDGHWSGEGTARSREDQGGCPLLRELAVLGRRTFADVIVIDDARLLGTKQTGGNGVDWPYTEFDWRHVTTGKIRAAYGREHTLVPPDMDRLILVPRD